MDHFKWDYSIGKFLGETKINVSMSAEAECRRNLLQEIIIVLFHDSFVSAPDARWRQITEERKVEDGIQRGWTKSHYA